ncbi:hypothetical protein [Methylomonas sp. YC3]
MAAYNLISKNDDIFLPPYPETPYWLRNYDNLWHMAANRLVLQVHSINDLDLVDRILSEKENTACITLIREPHDGLVSWINASLFHEMVRSNSPPADLCAFIQKLMDIGPYRHLIRSARIADKASRQLVLDVSAFNMPQIEKTQALICDLFGIRNIYGSIMEKENSYFSRFLYEQVIPVDVLHGKLEVKFSGYGDIVDNPYMVRLFEFPSPDLWAEFMPQDRQITAYLQLTSDFNNYSTPMGKFGFVVDLVKTWIKERLYDECRKISDDFKACMTSYETVKINTLDDIPDFGHRQLLAEIRAFYDERYPEIVSTWDSLCSG